MDNNILGLHHITAIASGAQQNYDFYTKLLGLRLVKKTVNFDDPNTYHFYFGDEVGTPGTILTFFPWEGVTKGTVGTGMATEIGFSVPDGSLDFWMERLNEFKLCHDPVCEKFGERYLQFGDPDDLVLNFIVSNNGDNRKPWVAGQFNDGVAIRGFHSVVLTVRNVDLTAKILTDIFGYKFLSLEGNRYRFYTDVVETANIVDIVADADGQRGVTSAGTNHHVAFRVKDENSLLEFREKISSAGLRITEKIDRNYFYSVYFREPGGVLFELATNNPGFATDEDVKELGTHLKLPPQYEAERKRIEEALPKLDQ